MVGVAQPASQQGFAIVTAGKHAQGASLHLAELASVNEEGLSRASTVAGPQVAASLVAGEEPEADGDASRMEELRRQRYDGVDQISLDDVLAYFALAPGMRGERTIGHDESCDPSTTSVGGCKVVDKMLYPSVVGVASSGVL